MSENFKLKNAWVLVVITLYAAVFLLNWNRLHYGVEISDEAYYVAEAHIVGNGAIPFTNNWTQVPGTTLLYWPIVKLFELLTGGTEGIFLFMRKAFLVYKVIVSSILFLLFKRKLPLILASLLPLPYLSLSPFSILNFSYNNLSLPFLLIGAILLYSALQQNESHGLLFSSLGGISVALACLAHMALVLIVFYLFLLLLLIERRRFRSFLRTVLFVLSGLLTALCVLGYLTLLSGGLTPVFEGLQNMLKQPYFHVKALSFTDRLMRFIESFKPCIRLTIITICVFACLLALRSIKKRPDFQFKTLLAIALMISQILNLIISAYTYSNYKQLQLDVTVSFVYVALIFLLIAGYKKYGEFTAIVAGPFVVFYVFYLFIHFNGTSSRAYVLFPCVLLSIILAYFSIEESPQLLKKSTGGLSLACIFAIALAGSVSATYVYAYLGYVYEDAPLKELTYKMERGIYKGLYTVEQRGQALLHLEDEINKVTAPGDYVLFMDQAPEAYLMTKATHRAPSTWDILLYAYAYWDNLDSSYDATDTSLLDAYFSSVKGEPSKIIYVLDSERLDQISLWNQDYGFTKYVKKHYQLIYENNAEMFAIFVLERNE